MIEPTVTLSYAVYERMLEQINYLDCLNRAGVDAWEGIPRADKLYDEWVKEQAAWQDNEQDLEQSSHS